MEESQLRIITFFKFDAVYFLQFIALWLVIILLLIAIVRRLRKPKKTIKLYVHAPGFGDYFMFKTLPRIGEDVVIRDKNYIVISVEHHTATWNNIALIVQDNVSTMEALARKVTI